MSGLFQQYRPEADVRLCRAVVVRIAGPDLRAARTLAFLVLTAQQWVFASSAPDIAKFIALAVTGSVLAQLY